MVERSPLLLLHGFMDTARTWDLVRPALAHAHDLIVPTLPGHHGGPPLDGAPTEETVLAWLEALLDAAGHDTVHIAGNSLGGYLALKLSARGRARSVVAFAPAGGWAERDPAPQRLLADQAELRTQVRAAVTQAHALVATPRGRRRLTRLLTETGQDLPDDLVLALIDGVAGCEAAEPLLANAQAAGFTLDPAAVACPVRVVWGTKDRLLPWPSAAARYRTAWLPHADWVVLDGVGHCPQLDVPLEAAQLILGWTS